MLRTVFVYNLGGLHYADRFLGTMAAIRIISPHIGKSRIESQAISDMIDYVANPQETDNGKLSIGYECDSRTGDVEFLLAKRQYIAVTGRVRGVDDVIAYRVRRSFKPREITPYEATSSGRRSKAFAERAATE